VICPIRSICSFVQAQAPVYDTVLAESRAGRKRTHPIWFVSAAHRAGRQSDGDAVRVTAV
jgi:uncharacterized protein (DUF1810 family)